ncbi:nuclear transport factor 2 family protein [Pedobacter glucosidilyticus]|uniref:nuclear transport factor 2 family protein n=1 Tax=Pedobacter glucosidilyticus TaxID=1122941 RepID=UPI0004036A47|nr:nuclear transport factor 2 family protein [Pedobacter glucosidilyticus]
MKTKNFLTAIVCFVLLSVSSTVMADEKNIDKKSMSFSIGTYIEVLKSGYHADYASIIAYDAKFNINRNGNTVTHYKADELKFNNNKNNAATQNCKISYKIITASDNYALVTVSMHYENFTRENIVSLSKIKDSWKITEVNSVFK